MSIRDLFDLVTGACWFALALGGIVLRLRRLARLERIRLLEPVDPLDVEYLASIKRSTHLRLAVKAVFLLGATIAVFDLTWLWWFWRVGIVLSLSFMLAETISVDRIRDRLGRHVEAPYREKGA